MGMGEASAWGMAWLRSLEYPQKVDAATCCSSSCSHTWPDLIDGRCENIKEIERESSGVLCDASRHLWSGDRGTNKDNRGCMFVRTTELRGLHTHTHTHLCWGLLNVSVGICASKIGVTLNLSLVYTLPLFHAMRTVFNAGVMFCSPNWSTWSFIGIGENSTWWDKFVCLFLLLFES